MTRRALPGDSSDTQSRYIEAAVDGILVGCCTRLTAIRSPARSSTTSLPGSTAEPLCQALLTHDVPVVLAGDYNVVPTPFDIYQTTSYDNDALVQPASRERYAALVAQGWTDAAAHFASGRADVHVLGLHADALARNAGLRLDHLLLSPGLADRLVAAGVDRAVRGEPGASDHAPAWIELRSPSRKKPRRSSVLRRRARARRPRGRAAKATLADQRSHERSSKDDLPASAA